MIEYEYKLMLSEKEYNYIINAFDTNIDTIIQMNHYYDTAIFDMYKKGITCRIREIGDYMCATMKCHLDSVVGGSEERSFSVYRVSEVMDFFGFHLRKQGCLLTERSTIKIPLEVLATLDKNTYLGKEDYELEIEYLEGNEHLAMSALKTLEQLLYDGGLIYSNDELNSRLGKAKSKSSRFFETKMNMLKEDTETLKKCQDEKQCLQF